MVGKDYQKFDYYLDNGSIATKFCEIFPTIIAALLPSNQIGRKVYI